MIRINLKSTKTSVSHLDFSEAGVEGTSTSLQGTVSKFTEAFKDIDWSEIESGVFIKIAINIILILSIPVALKVYEIKRINETKALKVQIEGDLESRKKTLTSLEKQMSGLGKFEKEAKEFDDKKLLFKKLANQRLKAPKILDQIQSVIPKYVWLKKVDLNIKEGSIAIEGESVSEDKVAQFVNDLGLNIIDNNTSQFNTSDLKEGKAGGNKLQFSLNAKIAKDEEQ